MKKTYISPETLTVELGTMQMMAESLTINTGSDAPEIGSSSEILTKETRDINLWDDEW